MVRNQITRLRMHRMLWLEFFSFLLVLLGRFARPSHFGAASGSSSRLFITFIGVCENKNCRRLRRGEKVKRLAFCLLFICFDEGMNRVSLMNKSLTAVALPIITGHAALCSETEVNEIIANFPHAWQDSRLSFSRSIQKLCMRRLMNAPTRGIARKWLIWGFRSELSFESRTERRLADKWKKWIWTWKTRSKENVGNWFRRMINVSLLTSSQLRR